MAKKRISYTNILSKECIVSAILQLTKNKPLSSISVSKLCNKAGVSRMTFGSIIFFVGLPPRNVLICYATLDRMEKQCCSFITDGEELKNNLLFLRQAT